MLIHLGNGYLVRGDDVIGIFDIDGETTPQITTDFLKTAQKRGECESAVLDIPRSFVLTGGREGQKIILSHISSSALATRKKGY